jgi:F-type H+-transporting ATPase subunit alpha
VDDIPVERIKEYQDKLTEFLTTRKDDLLRKIGHEKQLTPTLTSELKTAADQFKGSWK